jgi:aerobic carbon-monoxide dehydrogenase medium subunit
LPLRKAGDYPVAIVSMAVAIGPDGSVGDIRVAVGSVEASARRWPQLEEQLLGRPLDPARAYELAKACAGVFTGRESVEAPGWYRVQVLPTLVRRAAEAVLEV